MPQKLSEVQQSLLITRLLQEPSDTKLAQEFGIHRKSIWRLRQKHAVQHSSTIDRRRERETTLPPAGVPVPDVSLPPTSPLPIIPTDQNPKVPNSDIKPSAPKVVVESESTTLSYFAVQIFGFENFKAVVKVVLEAASKQGLLFRKLQVLDVTSIGAFKFIRFRADLQDINSLANGLIDRGVIFQNGGTYFVHFVDGRNGKVPASTMCAVSKVGFGQTFVGTRIKRWKAQFAA